MMGGMVAGRHGTGMRRQQLESTHNKEGREQRGRERKGVRKRERRDWVWHGLLKPSH